MNEKNSSQCRSSFVIVLLMVFGLLVCCTGFVSAHSPSSMTLSYDLDAQELTVEISHQVSDTSTHFVENIKVKVNGDPSVNQDYTSQPGNTFTYTYDTVQAEEGDEIEVTAICNLGGNIQQQLTVTAGGGSTSDDTPGFGLIVVLISLSMLIILRRRKQ